MTFGWKLKQSNFDTIQHRLERYNHDMKAKIKQVPRQRKIHILVIIRIIFVMHQFDTLCCINTMQGLIASTKIEPKYNVHFVHCDWD